MKKFFFILSALIVVFTCSAQAPQKISYQAAVRNSSNHPVADSPVGMQISILQGTPTGNAVYVETQNPTTDTNGLVSFEIGAGTLVSGNFSNINWEAGPFYIKTETDPAGGTSYSISGVSQLLSVPYALHAEKANSATETDPLYSVSPAAGITTVNKTNWDNAYSWGNHSTQGYLKPTARQSGDLLTWDGSNWISRKLRVNVYPEGLSYSFSIMQPYLTLNYCICLNGIYPTRDSMEPFVGEIELFGFNFAPMGYAKCDGQLLQITQYAALYSLIGNIYGGNGTTNFALPDLRGRVPVHQGQGQNLTLRQIGQNGGTENAALMINHSHATSVFYE